MGSYLSLPPLQPGEVAVDAFLPSNATSASNSSNVSVIVMVGGQKGDAQTKVTQLQLLQMNSG